MTDIPLSHIQSLLYSVLRYTYEFCELDNKVPKVDGQISYPTPIRMKLYDLVRHIDYNGYKLW